MALAKKRTPFSKMRARRDYRRDGASLPKRALFHARRLYHRGDLYGALRTVALMAGSAGGALAIFHPRPDVKDAGREVAAMSAGAAASAEVARAMTRSKYAPERATMGAIKSVKSTEDANLLRRLERSLVLAYDRDPKYVTRHLDGTTESVAQHFRSVRGLRLAPDAEYRVSLHEDEEHAELIKGLLQYMVGKLPRREEREAILEKHFPGEELKPIKIEDLEMPRGLDARVPRALLDASPRDEKEALALALMGASVARAREKKFAP